MSGTLDDGNFGVLIFDFIHPFNPSVHASVNLQNTNIVIAVSNQSGYFFELRNAFQTKNVGNTKHTMDDPRFWFKRKK